MEHSMPNRVVSVSVDLDGISGPTLKITVDDPAAGKQRSVEFSLARGPSVVDDIKRAMNSAEVELAKRKP